MIFDSCSRFPGAQRLAGIAAAIAVFSCSSVWAQAAASVNGTEISADVFNMYLTSRLNKPAAEATPTERTTVLSELQDIYLLTTQPSALELAEHPSMQAQIELQTRGMLAQAVAADFLDKNQATEEEILSEYENQMKVAPPLEYKARHILVETQSAAQDLVAKLEGGADFAELAKEESTGPSGPNGGDLGWFAPERMVPPFSAAVADLENGAFSKEPVQTQFGWHVILREDSRESTPPTLESVRDVVKQRLEQQKLTDYLNELRATLAE